MASVKIVRRKNKQRKDGTAPLAIRISKDYKTNYVFISQYVLEKDWNKDAGLVKRSHLNAKKLNNYLRKRLTEANDLYLTSNVAISTQQAKEKLKGPGGTQSFFEFAAKRVERKFNKKVYSVAKSEMSILYNLSEFLSKDDTLTLEQSRLEIKKRRKKRISKARKNELHLTDAIADFKKNKKLHFQDISDTFIKNYKVFCSSHLEHKTRTVTNQLIFIRTLFNSAIKEGVVDATFYPFAGDNEKIKIGSSHKIGLISNEVERIESLKLEEQTSIWHTKNVWLTAFYFAGIRISDAVQLKWTEIKDGRLLYTMDKNEKPVSLKISEKATKILENYMSQKIENNGYVFPFLKDVSPFDEEDLFRKIRNATKLFNKYLKRIASMCEIDKNLSNHIARHTFGNIAGDRIHPLMLQKLYRHSDLKTTLNYQANFIHKDADEALDSVVNF